MKWLVVGWVLAVATAAAAQQAPPLAAPGPSPLEGRVVGITDGDTLTLLVGGEPVRIRLAQIDAPEKRQPYGDAAKQALSALAFGKPARVEVVDRDRYGRTVGEVFVDGVDVNQEMVRRGHAWAYTRYSHSVEIVALEDEARAAGRGLWALPGDRREAPWLWRREARTPAAPVTHAAPLACGERRTCDQMTRCEEARFYLEQCGLRALDGDGDGVPCEALCGSGR